MDLFLTAYVMILIRAISTVINKVTQVVFRDTVTVGTDELVVMTRKIRRYWRGTVHKCHVINNNIAHVADASLGSKTHLLIHS